MKHQVRFTVIETSRQNYKLISTAIATIGAGIPIWTQPVRAINYLDPHFLVLWLGIGVVCSFTALFFVTLKMSEMVSTFTIGYVLALVGNFVGGILINNYIHTQFSISLPIAMGIGIISGAIGSLIWKWIKKARR